MADSKTISLGTVLVVGGCGFLGSHLINQLMNFPNENSEEASNGDIKGSTLLKPRTSTTTLPKSSSFHFPSLKSRYPTYTNTKVHVLDLRCNKNRLPGVDYHEADITTPEVVLEVFKKVKPDVVFHTASPPWDSPKPILHKVNVGGTKVLLEVAGGQHGSWGGTCKGLVYTSSSSVIHDSHTDLIFADERYPVVIPNPVEYYSETKVSCAICL